MARRLIAVSLLALVGACGEIVDNSADSTANASVEQIANEGLPPIDNAISADGAAPATDAWIGRWTGVEGLAIDIEPVGDRIEGLYDLTITTLDGVSSYEGRAAGDVIEFERDGAIQTVRAATGDETGLRYLGGKRNCLMTVEFEGFCRD